MDIEKTHNQTIVEDSFSAFPWSTLILALGVVVGQFLEISEVPTVISTVGTTLLWIRAKRSAIFFAAVLCGVLQVSLLPQPLTVHEQRSERYVFGEMQILSKPSQRRVGELQFRASFRVRGEKSQYRLSCIAKNLPWRNITQAKEGSLLTAFIQLIPLRNGEWGRRETRRGLQGRCKIVYLSLPLKTAGSPSLSSFKSQLHRSIRMALPSHEGGGILMGMLLGNSTGISRSTRETFREWGIAHLLVVSGLHVGALFFIVRLSLGFLLSLFLTSGRSHFYVRYIPEIFGVLSVWGYLSLLGAPISATRAACAITLFVLLGFFELQRGFLRQLLYAALYVVSVWPGVWEELGFQLTFSALLGILAAGKLTHSFRKHSYLLFALLPSLFTSIVLYVHLGKFPPYGPVGNLLAAPLLLFVGFYGGVLLLATHLVSETMSALLGSTISSFLEGLLSFLESISTVFDADILSLGLISYGGVVSFAMWIATFGYVFTLAILRCKKNGE